MSDLDKEREGRGLTGLLGRRRIKITGTHKGDMRADKPVSIEYGATAVGQLFAPQLTVAGLLYGTVVARQVKVVASGQIWGDVHTMRLEIEEGGKIQGWVSDLSEAEYESLWAAPETLDQDQPLEPPDLPAEATDISTSPRSADETEAMHLLRARAGEALAAQAELDLAFEERVTEAAGERAARVTTLEKELVAANEALENSRRENTSLTEELDRLREHLDQQTSSLQEARDGLLESGHKLDALQGVVAERDREIGQLQAERKEMEARLQKRRDRVDELQGRVESLEAALQAGLETESDQQQSLQRWQELAEVTQKKAAALEQDLATLRQQAADPAKTETLREHLQKSDQQLSQLLAELQAKDADIVNLEQQLLWQKAENESVHAKMEQATKQVAESGERLGELETALSEAQALLMGRELRLEGDEEATAERVVELEAKLKEQARLVGRIKKAADDRIRELQERLARGA